MTTPEPKWLTEAELTAWMPLHGILIALPAALDSQLQRDFGMSLYGYSVLASLSDAPDRTLQMTELATWTNGSLSRLSRAVGVLERNGWVTRRPNPVGRRSVLATLTDAGAAQMERVAPTHVAVVRDLVVDRLDPADLAVLGRYARTILGGVIGEELLTHFAPSGSHDGGPPD